MKPRSLRHPAETAAALAPPAMRVKPLIAQVSAVPREVADKIYKTWMWDECRALVLAFSGHACVACGSQDRLQIDHVEPLALADPATYRPFDPDNLQPLCSDCHNQKTKSFDSDHATRRRGPDPRRDKRGEALRHLLASAGRQALASRGVRWEMTLREWIDGRERNLEVSI